MTAFCPWVYINAAIASERAKVEQGIRASGNAFRELAITCDHSDGVATPFGLSAVESWLLDLHEMFPSLRIIPSLPSGPFLRRVFTEPARWERLRIALSNLRADCETTYAIIYAEDDFTKPDGFNANPPIPAYAWHEVALGLRRFGPRTAIYPCYYGTPDTEQFCHVAAIARMPLIAHGWAGARSVAGIETWNMPAYVHLVSLPAHMGTTWPVFLLGGAPQWWRYDEWPTIKQLAAPYPRAMLWSEGSFPEMCESLANAMEAGE